jgi:hypothetical protein
VEQPNKSRKNLLFGFARQLRSLACYSFTGLTDGSIRIQLGEFLQ